MAFYDETFTIFHEMEAAGPYEYVEDNRASINQYIKDPFRELMQSVMNGLPADMAQYLNITPGDIYSRFNKNDYGQHGVSAMYWAGIFPNRYSSKLIAPQMLVFMNANIFEFGMYFGLHANNTSAGNPLLTYKRNIREVIDAGNLPQLIAYLRTALPDEQMAYRALKDFESEPDKFEAIASDPPFSWDAYFELVDESDTDAIYNYAPVCAYIPASILDISTIELVERITHVLTALFPLIVLPTAHDSQHVLACCLANDYAGLTANSRDYPSLTPAVARMLEDEIRDAEKPIKESYREGSIVKALALIARRRGQPDFRASLIAAYDGRCAITGCNAAQALEAAHIIPFCASTDHSLLNGLLLRADIHILFDLGLIAIDPDTYNVMMARELAQTVYAEYEDKRIALPDSENDWPSKDNLRAHLKYHKYVSGV